MADKTKQYEDLRREIERRIKFYQGDLKEVDNFIYFKENLIVYDEDSPLLKVAKYFIRYELESEVIKRLKNTPIFIDDDGNYRETTKEDIKELIEFMSKEEFLLFFEKRKREELFDDYCGWALSGHIVCDDETEEKRKARERMERERNKRLDKFKSELEEFQTIGKMLRFMLDCKKNKKGRKLLPKNYDF